MRMVGWGSGRRLWNRVCRVRGRVVGLGDGLRFAKLERWLIAAFRGLAMALLRAAHKGEKGAGYAIPRGIV